MTHCWRSFPSWASSEATAALRRGHTSLWCSRSRASSRDTLRRRAAPSRLELDWDLLPDRFGFGPAQAAESGELFLLLQQAVVEDLTAQQRRIFVAIVLQNIPLDVLVEELGSNRNAIYKSLFDARRKLRRRLVANGYMLENDVVGR